MQNVHEARLHEKHYQVAIDRYIHVTGGAGRWPCAGSFNGDFEQSK